MGDRKRIRIIRRRRRHSLRVAWSGREVEVGFGGHIRVLGGGGVGGGGERWRTSPREGGECHVEPSKGRKARGRKRKRERECTC